jgi:hypothetical protein
MSAERVLNEDWSEYDNRKKKEQDGKFISFDEGWEQEYLKKKLRKIYPGRSEATLDSAIASCRRMVPAPHPRKAFMDCVHPKL